MLLSLNQYWFQTMSDIKRVPTILTEIQHWQNNTFVPKIIFVDFEITWRKVSNQNPASTTLPIVCPKSFFAWPFRIFFSQNICMFSTRHKIILSKSSMFKVLCESRDDKNLLRYYIISFLVFLCPLDFSTVLLQYNQLDRLPTNFVSIKSTALKA